MIYAPCLAGESAHHSVDASAGDKSADVGMDPGWVGEAIPNSCCNDGFAVIIILDILDGHAKPLMCAIGVVQSEG